MATRFYFENDPSTASPPGGQPSLTPAFDAAWGISGAAVRRWLTTTKLGTAMGTSAGITETTATSPIDVLFAQFISAPLAGQTISGTVKGQMRVVESNAAADMRAQVVIWVMKPDGTSRGTLLAADASALSSEFATGTLTNRKFPLAAISPAALTSTAVTAGDRLIVEVGYRAHNSVTTSYNSQFRYGTAAGSDLAENETATTDDNPWIELSGTITFANVAGSVTQEAVQVVAADTTPTVRVTQEAVQAVLTDTTPTARVTQVGVQVVCERDYAGWDLTFMTDDPTFNEYQP